MSSRRALWLILAASLAGCSQSETSDRLPSVSLPTASAQKSASLASCAARKCLTVYVAPWCHYCRESTPLLLELRKYLKKHDVETRFVVGKDGLPALLGYAQAFGPDTMLDVHDQLGIGGVPHFFVSDPQGVILRDFAGLPADAVGRSAEDAAAAFGLP